VRSTYIVPEKINQNGFKKRKVSMIRISTALLFFVFCNILNAQSNNFTDTLSGGVEDKHSKHSKNTQTKNLKKANSTQKEVIVYIAYKVNADSTTFDVRYIPMPNQPEPEQKMIEEAIQIVSKMIIVPEKDATGEIINNKKVAKIKFNPIK